MNTNKKIIAILFTCLLVIFSNIEIFSLEKDKNIKVGLYSYAPYYYKDKNNNITGYYHEFLDILCKDANITYEYVNVDIDSGLEKLKSKEIDILLGLHYSEERFKELIYSENYISLDNKKMYIKDMNISYGNLKYLNEKKLAYIKGDLGDSWISNALKSKNVNIDLIGGKNLDECINMFKRGEVELISLPQGNNSLTNYNKIFKYSAGMTYIVGNENSRHIIKKFDEVINTKYKSQYNNKLLNLYNKYFRKEIIAMHLAILCCIFLLIAIISYKIIYPFVKKRVTRRKVILNKKNDNFILYYQPIVNSNNNEVVGFESLLRLKYKNNKILPPSCFIKDIKVSDMFVEMNLWILERVIYDYKVISNYNCYKNEDFYISINLSFEELENEYFVNKIIEISNENKIKPGSICLEIVEKIGIKDLKNIKTTIKNLKNNGFKIAIDDFGIEYANLNILEIIEFDIIKLDKYFADNIVKSKINNEVIKFISNITLITNKYFVIEGVEENYQIEEIKKICHNNIYIQGYFYSKPIPIEEIKEFTIRG
ncbi:MAG: EAL domain-containing protein [Terrisporobacter othiniensis]|uniref:EAL domain-containing protein n=1 Tax=Terrisporobacter othiniensis TaxID=1577792 RepID=UPI002914FF0C|nr:EAL domain-containing protein [Terrisporobacter othiniensis]MDU6983874.1 EAL domain-containing protein [Terrisporobacter othiniensis]